MTIATLDLRYYYPTYITTLIGKTSPDRMSRVGCCDVHFKSSGYEILAETDLEVVTRVLSDTSRLVRPTIQIEATISF